jgi:hypothetical protein
MSKMDRNPTGAYCGEIIEESLVDPSVLKYLPVISTWVEKVRPEHGTPWLTQWTMYTIVVPEEDAAGLAQALSHEIENSHNGHWYIDFKNKTTHYIIFPNKVFKVDRRQPDQFKPVVSYGLRLNIPLYQLDFFPEINHRERPE